MTIVKGREAARGCDWEILLIHPAWSLQRDRAVGSCELYSLGAANCADQLDLCNRSSITAHVLFDQCQIFRNDQRKRRVPIQIWAHESNQLLVGKAASLLTCGKSASTGQMASTTRQPRLPTPLARPRAQVTLNTT
jgi:hypothetical protein